MNHNLYPATIYRPCDRRCQRCDACRDFARVVRELDLDAISKLDQQRRLEALLRRER